MNPHTSNLCDKLYHIFINIITYNHKYEMKYIHRLLKSKSLKTTLIYVNH